jgi:hypothetical protein
MKYKGNWTLDPSHQIQDRPKKISFLGKPYESTIWRVEAMLPFFLKTPDIRKTKIREK